MDHANDEFQLEYTANLPVFPVSQDLPDPVDKGTHTKHIADRLGKSHRMDQKQYPEQQINKSKHS